MTSETSEFAHLPQEQYEYFAGRSPSAHNVLEIDPHEFVYGGGLSCPHEAKRTAAARQYGSPGRPSSGTATQPPSASTRADIFDKYKQYFASGNTPLSQSLNRSERSASRLSDAGAPQRAAPRSDAGVGAAARPPFLRGQQQQQPSETGSAPASIRGGHAPTLQEPQKQSGAASVRSNASSATPAAPVRSNGGAPPVNARPAPSATPSQASSSVAAAQQRKQPQLSQPQQPQRQQQPRQQQPQQRQQPQQQQPQQQQPQQQPQQQQPQQQQPQQRQQPQQQQPQQQQPQQPQQPQQRQQPQQQQPQQQQPQQRQQPQQPQQPQQQQPQQQQQPARMAEHPIVQRPTQQADPENFYSPVGAERASTSTRASEPQVISVLPYDSVSDRVDHESGAYPDEVSTPRPVMGIADPNTYETSNHGGQNAMEELPQSSAGGAGSEVEDEAAAVAAAATEREDDAASDFSDRSASGADEKAGENAYEQPAAVQVTSREPPRRPSYSRMSHSTASVATVSSVRRNDPPKHEYAASKGTESVRDDARSAASEEADEEVYTFRPTINARSRNLASRRPDYGQDSSERLFNDADYVRKGMGKKQKYQELDQDSANIRMPRQPPQQRQRSSSLAEGEVGVFSRLYTDAQRYNEHRAERERQLELQRMRDRGELSDNDDLPPEGSQETAQPHRRSRADGGDGSEEEEDETKGKARPPSQKRHVDPEVFDRLSRPAVVVKKFVQIKEEEERQQQEAAKHAEDARAEEMKSIAAYTWAIPAASFSIADLQRQNTLFVS